MIVLAVIVDGPLTRERERVALADVAGDLESLRGGGWVGATLRFEGIVRRIEPSSEEGGGERAIVALDYETYDPMAGRELELLARGVGERHGLRSIVALHSRGRVGVGEVSFVVEVTARRRSDTLAAMADFINRLKQDVPIWKRPVWAL